MCGGGGKVPGQDWAEVGESRLGWGKFMIGTSVHSSSDESVIPLVVTGSAAEDTATVYETGTNGSVIRRSSAAALPVDEASNYGHAALIGESAGAS